MLLTYIKVVEEREMVTRFGEEYLAYRAACRSSSPDCAREADVLMENRAGGVPADTQRGRKPCQC
jgi:hypothetical protein